MRGDGIGIQSCVEVGFDFCGRDVPDGLEQTAVVEPVHPFEGRVFDGLETAPWTAAVDDLGLEQAVDRLGQCVVVAVAPTLPTEGSMPAPPSRSVYRMDGYWEPRSAEVQLWPGGDVMGGVAHVVEIAERVPLGPEVRPGALMPTAAGAG